MAILPKSEYTLAEDKYITAELREIIRPKFKSVVSDHQRNLHFSKAQSISLGLEEAKVLLKKAVTKWTSSYLDFSDPEQVKLGTRLSPVVDGVKEHLLVTGLEDSDRGYTLTFFSHAKSNVTWTTFKLRKSLIFSGKSSFTYDQRIIKTYIHDRLSFHGQGEIIEARKNFAKVFKEFKRLFNEIMESA